MLHCLKGVCVERGNGGFWGGEVLSGAREGGYCSVIWCFFCDVYFVCPLLVNIEEGENMEGVLFPPVRSCHNF